MGTLRIPILEDAKDIAPKRRAAGFYFGCQCKDDASPADPTLVEDQELPPPLPVARIADDDSSAPVIILGVGEHPEGDMLGGSVPTVDDDDDNEQDSRDNSQDTGEYLLPVGFPFHEDSDEEGY